MTPLDSLALSRGTVDRLTEKRSDREWLDAAWADPATRVLVVSDGQALARIDDESAALIFLAPDQAPDGTSFLLGQDDADGTVYFGVSGPLPPALDGTRPAALREVGTLLGDRDAGLLTHAVALANWHDTHTHCPVDGTPTVVGPGGHFTVCPKDGTEHFPRTDGTRPAALREVGTLLGDRDAGLLTHAVALANWHDTHTHCPVDGTPTVVGPGGHFTVCPKDGTEHFPRTDPAVIMLVTAPDDRALLARNAAWPGRRVSILAGFVDPGESAEHAVIREVASPYAPRTAPSTSRAPTPR